MSIEVKRVTEEKIDRSDNNIKPVINSDRSGWVSHISEFSFTKFHIISFNSKLNYSVYSNTLEDFLSLIEKTDPNDFDSIITEFKFEIVDSIAQMISDNKESFFNNKLGDEEFKWRVQEAIYPFYWDAFFCMLDSFWSSKRQNKNFIKRLACDGITETVILSNIEVKYNRLSDNQLISDNYPIIVSVPSCISPINHPKHDNYSVSCLGGLMSPSSRFVSCDATSKIDIKSSLYHETLHCIFNTLRDALRNDMYGSDELSQFEEMVAHFNTDRFSSLMKFRDALSNLQLVFDSDRDEITVISDDDDLSYEIQVDLEFDPSSISYLAINSNSNDSLSNDSNCNHITNQSQVPMVSSMQEEIAKRMVESNTYNLKRDNINLALVGDFIKKDDIIKKLSCEQDKHLSSYHSFLRRIFKK